ncbi:hypothetical protein [Exiguobacterium aurantiacum]|uniref:hypothetical protein n=1 Tax=Exiguobacterium aurantiacum TaxID=33987 RepID=UPI00384D493A
MQKIEYYRCFSINMLRFIRAHGIEPVSKGVHPVTARTFWLFEMDAELSRILKTWSKNKPPNRH